MKNIKMKNIKYSIEKKKRLKLRSIKKKNSYYLTTQFFE